MFKIKKLATYEVIQYLWSTGAEFKPVDTFLELLKEVGEEMIRKFSIDEDLVGVSNILTGFWKYVDDTKGYATEDRIKDKIEIRCGHYKACIRTFVSGSGRTTEYVANIESENCGVTLVIQVGRRIPIDV